MISLLNKATFVAINNVAIHVIIEAHRYKNFIGFILVLIENNVFRGSRVCVES